MKKFIEGNEVTLHTTLSPTEIPVPLPMWSTKPP